jgi:hypothetical protein
MLACKFTNQLEIMKIKRLAKIFVWVQPEIVTRNNDHSLILSTYQNQLLNVPQCKLTSDTLTFLVELSSAACCKSVFSQVKKNNCPTFWRLFSMMKMCCFVIFTDLNFVNKYFSVLKNSGFHWCTLYFGMYGKLIYYKCD